MLFKNTGSSTIIVYVEDVVENDKKYSTTLRPQESKVLDIDISGTMMIFVSTSSKDKSYWSGRVPTCSPSIEIKSDGNIVSGDCYSPSSPPVSQPSQQPTVVSDNQSGLFDKYFGISIDTTWCTWIIILLIIGALLLAISNRK